ncbi:AraC family transcriptional regulator [Paeniglutamicibacter sp. NPDC091659]|uniref:AraC family transcriptional regulator n=1 Tax=Paeniglutamicibacter sp. NPDC091659 TaxID=3364389 RepID=UPI00380B084E
MTVKLHNFAETPPMASRVQTQPDELDALSEILNAIHLRGGTVTHQSNEYSVQIAYPAGARLVHIIEHGSASLRLEKENSTLVLHAGDLVLVPHGEAHALISYAPASWVTGTFIVEDAVADPLLSVLPASIVIRGGENDNGWLRLSLDLLLAEVTLGGPGTQVMVSRILDLLFIHALRAWSADGTASPGWLTAAMDSSLGPVLSAIHRNPEQQWTVEGLALRANLSRSAFAGRFSRLLGTSPIAYIAERRLGRAAYLLRSTADPVGQIAVQVGYTSEAAFSRAFRRRFGVPPRRWNTTPPAKRGTTNSVGDKVYPPDGREE